MKSTIREREVGLTNEVKALHDRIRRMHLSSKKTCDDELSLLQKKIESDEVGMTGLLQEGLENTVLAALERASML